MKSQNGPFGSARAGEGAERRDAPPAMGTSASDASATRRWERRRGDTGDLSDDDDDDDDGAGSFPSRPVARAVAIGATARRDADRRGFLARIVARVVAANEQGVDVIPPRTPACPRVWAPLCQVSAFC